MHQVTLDPSEETKLTWMVDWPERNVFFQVKNGINERYRWFALGFSRRGDFPRTDFCIFQRENGKIDVNAVSHKSNVFDRNLSRRNKLEGISEFRLSRKERESEPMGAI